MVAGALEPKRLGGTAADFDAQLYRDWAARLQACATHNPRAFLGRHNFNATLDVVRFFLPDAVRVAFQVGERLQEPDYALDGLYACLIPRSSLTPEAEVHWGGGVVETLSDPYSLPLVLGDLDLHLFAEGQHLRLFEVLGCTWQNGLARFAVWAPNAQAVSLIGDMNAWDPRRHPLENRGASGVWELSLPAAQPGQSYKFHLSVPGHPKGIEKTDPYGVISELRPKTASRVPQPDFLEDKAADAQYRMRHDKPMSIYEVHLGSWRKHEGWRFYSYTELANELVDYAVWMGFTHIELLPLHEHPLDESWGYQPTGLYAATRRYGPPEGLKALVRAAHAKGLGVILDWVPAHFPKDAHGLARFDGTALYEHMDPQQGEHQDWGTLIYNFGRPEVRAFLKSNAAFWIEVYGIDALRVDAVASMLYLDYSREAGQWRPNAMGGRENLEAIAFLRELNREIFAAYPHASLIAEESTAWPGVSRPLNESAEPVGPLGFGFKWNMGWMNDTLSYLTTRPIHRAYHHRDLTFGLDYIYDENFILPISHDEVVHGKGTLLGRARQASEGDAWQAFANLRAYLGFMFGHPGKKLLFMGQELAAPFEWSSKDPLDWSLERETAHAQVQAYVQHLNQLYTSTAALYEGDCVPGGFAWLEGGDMSQSVLSILRFDQERSAPALMVSNFTPVPRSYQLGVPLSGTWQSVSNSDSTAWGGSGYEEGQRRFETQAQTYQGQPYSLRIPLPPLATLILQPEQS